MHQKQADVPDTSPRQDSKGSRWTRHLFYRAERTTTTWTLRLGVLAIVVVAVWLTGPWWTAAVGRSLVCDASVGRSDAILIENFDPDYLLFERAARLRRAGLAPRVLVPVNADRGGSVANGVSLGTAELMARIARLGPFDVIPLRHEEPISLNAAWDLLRFLEKERVRSVIVVSPLFRSRRSAMVYAATFGRAGITVYCQPVEGSRGVNTWTKSWHGMQEVAEQWLKLQYYRVYVRPSSSQRPG
jgi:hypothetical protein